MGSRLLRGETVACHSGPPNKKSIWGIIRVRVDLEQLAEGVCRYRQESHTQG